MKKIKYFPKPIGVPEKSPFFTGAVAATIICLPFWMFILSFF